MFLFTSFNGKLAPNSHEQKDIATYNVTSKI